MNLTRFYRGASLASAKLRAARDILKSSMNWQVTSCNYTLYYCSERYEVLGTDAMEGIVSERGEPDGVLAIFRTQRGSRLAIDSRSKSRISIEVNSRNSKESEILNKLEGILELTPVDAVASDIAIRDVFLCHGFDETGESVANQVGRFLELLEFRVHSGRTFAPKSVSEKVQERLAKYDMVVAILTPSDDITWITQEMAAAQAMEKPLFLLVQDEVSFKAGILGDLEYIRFPAGQVCRCFIPILEGLKTLQGAVLARGE